MVQRLGSGLVKHRGRTLDSILDELGPVEGMFSSVKAFAPVGGFYNDAVVQAAQESKLVFLGGDVPLNPNALLDLSAFSDTTFFGGTFINGQILFRGTLSAPTSISAAIPKWANTFQSTASVATGDLILVQNYPTSAMDGYTSGGASLFQGGARTYSSEGPGMLRHTRRKQLLDVASKAGTAISTFQQLIDDMVIDGLEVFKVTPVKNVHLACDIRGGTVWAEFTDGFHVSGNLQDVFLNNKCTIRSKLEPASFKSTSDARIDLFEGCTGFTIDVVASGHLSSADNSIIKILGCHNFRIDAVVSGTHTGTGYAHGVMIDTEYTENPSGYPCLPCNDYVINCTASGIPTGSHAVFIVTDPYRAYNSNGTINVQAANHSVLLKGAREVSVQGRCNTIGLNGSGNCDVSFLTRNEDLQWNWTSPFGDVTNFSNAGVMNVVDGAITITGESSPGTVAISANRCTYQREGRVVFVDAEVQYTGLTGTGNLTLLLPSEWSPKGNTQGKFACSMTVVPETYGELVYGTRNVQFFKRDGTKVQAEEAQAGSIRLHGNYIVDFVG